ncbi:hypothetical protein SAMN04490206_5208 [Pseudomonas umsongensis]|nr:hypothetical protein SAMN04490206_5208 [Pseudomonas umsongensis]
MLAMVVNDNAGCLIPSGAPSFIASMLAPTGAGVEIDVTPNSQPGTNPRSAIT